MNDNVDGDVGGARARLAKTMKPTGRTFTGKSDSGNGDPCPTEGHGRMWVLASGRQWCPDQSHDKEKVK
jgi:hypothetical protein